MPLREKIDPDSAFIASVHIPAENTAIDGVLPEEVLDLVAARGIGMFEGKTMVQIGRMRGRAPVGIIYRPSVEYAGFRKGRN